MDRLILTGTDTGVGKTVLAAAIVGAAKGRYWKPVQAGAERDADVVRRLAPGACVLPEAYALPEPLCPSVAARRAGVAIALPASPPPGPGPGPLIIEGAGGVLVPINATQTMADLFAALAAPAVLVARTALGTINHTLLSLEALRARRIPVLGVVFTGPDAPETIAEVERFGAAPTLGRLPPIEPLDARTLAAAARIALAPLWKILGIHA